MRHLIFIYFINFINVLIQSTPIFAQTSLEKAEKYFSVRCEIIDNGKANSSNIDDAIKFYKKSNAEPERTIGLLKSYEFKASWTDVSKNEKLALYEKAITLAENKTIDFPENGAIAYWHVANYARRADLLNITEAAQEGVIDKIKSLAEKAIKLDEYYNQAGALRLLGGIHLEVPSIPLILSWPSYEEAEKLLERAYQIAPEHPANVYLYAKLLYEIDEISRSEKLLEELIKRTPRKHFELVDAKYIQKGQEFFENNFDY
ncbi:tetratricopeptide repeat protein [Marivirga sp.]|uniref:tetratricopeptide repeat protein n=1 Tax=Marivirga sp. TaxID=2018662 RepID=UPI002D7E5CE8|nr:tetratricopeptide repeat protein [Marivirga sp.]HET8859319.1 tetratricopeptide repeat protein [Marivirga sp.]